MLHLRAAAPAHTVQAGSMARCGAYRGVMPALTARAETPPLTMVHLRNHWSQGCASFRGHPLTLDRGQEPNGSRRRQNADLPRKIWALGPSPVDPRCFNCYVRIGSPKAASSNSTRATPVLAPLLSQEQLKPSILGFQTPTT